MDGIASNLVFRRLENRVVHGVQREGLAFGEVPQVISRDLGDGPNPIRFRTVCFSALRV